MKKENGKYLVHLCLKMIDGRIVMANLKEEVLKEEIGQTIPVAMAFALEDAKKCYVREEKVEEITDIWNKRHPNQEFHPH